jgi:hypothetical protein
MCLNRLCEAEGRGVYLTVMLDWYSRYALLIKTQKGGVKDEKKDFCF